MAEDVHGSENRYQTGCRCDRCELGHLWYRQWMAQCGQIHEAEAMKERARIAVLDQGVTRRSL